MSAEEQRAWQSEDEDDQCNRSMLGEAGDPLRRGLEVIRKHRASGAYEAWKKHRAPAPPGVLTMSAKAELDDGSSASMAAVHPSTTTVDSEMQM
jgi:hypothetical protein